MMSSGFVASGVRSMKTQSGRSLLAFLVDDDPFSARFLIERLADWDGLEIRWFPTTNEALDGLAASAQSDSKCLPDLVLVDLKNKYSANEDFALSAAPFVKNLGTPMIVLAARPDEELIYMLTTAGVRTVLDRSAKTEEIEAGLFRALGEQTSTAQLHSKAV